MWVKRDTIMHVMYIWVEPTRRIVNWYLFLL